MAAKPLTFISLFAGIGGMDLGLERAGLRCVAQVEIDDYATKVLAKHWPDVARFRDVRHVGAHNLPRADLICGGFPCQDISDSGPRVGIAGERSGLWREFARVVRELRPRYVLVENVAALLGRGLDIVSACALGAPHTRERLFILAYATEEYGNGRGQRQRSRAISARGEAPIGKSHTGQIERLRATKGWWASEPDVGRMAHGVPARMDRLGGLGNAVVPQVAEFIGHAITRHSSGI